MERAYQLLEADSRDREYAEEAAHEQAITDALYGSLETLPDTVVRGLDD